MYLALITESLGTLHLLVLDNIKLRVSVSTQVYAAVDVPLCLFATGSGEPGDTERFLPCPV